jgi:integrase
MAAFDLATVTGRAKLKARSTPYYVRRIKGLYLGLRVGKEGATWCGRYQAPGKVKPQFITFLPLDEMTHEQAARQCDVWGESLRHGRPVARHDRTVADVVHFYLDMLKKKPKRKSDGKCASYHPEHLMRIHLLGQAAGVREVTYRNSDKVVQRKCAAFPVHPLAFRVAHEVIESEFEHWRDTLVSASGEPLKPGSIGRITSILVAALNLAVKKRLIPNVRQIEWKESLKQLQGGSRDRALNQKEIAKLLKGCLREEFRNLCHVGVLTGARYSEIAGMRVQDFDARRGLLKVDGKTGPRTFPVTDEARAVLVQLCKGKLPLAYICPNYYGEKWQPSQQTYSMNQMRERTGFGHDVSFYTLRHTFITQALTCENPLPPLTVADICGTSLLMIDKHYGHLIEANHAPVRGIRIAS